jgi:RNA-directed DNA polymerase
MTNGPGKSDRPVVPEKSPNKAGQPVAEGMEGSGLAKGNLPQQNASRTPSRKDAPSALERVRQAAGKDKKLRFTALLHHIYNLETLRMAYLRLKKEAAPGVDGETWRHYGEQLEGNLQNLAERLKRGAYRAKPVRRVYIPKADGRQRPLGVTALEDKIVQRAAVEVLNAIYETDFLGFSYGFRPGRSQHQALDALYTGLLTRKVNWVLDLDIKGFFDGLSHEWLVKFIEHRIADRRVVRLIQKWLKCSKARCHPSGCESHRQNRPGAVVVISSGEKGDRLDGSLEVKAPVAGRNPGQIRTGGEQLDRPQQKRTRKPRNFWPAGSGLQGTWERRAFFS